MDYCGYFSLYSEQYFINYLVSSQLCMLQIKIAQMVHLQSCSVQACAKRNPPAQVISAQ